MISLYDSSIADVLPAVLKEMPEVKALGYSIKMGMQRMLRYAENTSVYAEVQKAPEYVLDALAIDLNTQFYSDKLDVETKRKIIAGTLSWYMRSGTPAAINELIEAVFGDGEVQEWYEYGGQPFEFRVSTNASGTEIDAATRAYFLKVLKNIKPERSVMGMINMMRLHDVREYVGAALTRTTIPEVIKESMYTGPGSGVFSMKISGADLVALYHGVEPDMVINESGELVLSIEEGTYAVMNAAGDLVYSY